MTRTLLTLDNVSKHFGENRVLKGVSLDIAQGQVHALLGGNGAGKSTLVRIIAGVYEADGGAVYFDGKALRQHSVGQARDSGIAVVYQEFSLVPTLSVAENVTLAHEPRRSLGFIDNRAARKLTRLLLERMDVRNISPRALVGNLPTSAWQLVEIAKALGQDVRCLILDEPNAALGPHETEVLFRVIRHLADSGVAVIYISHRIDEVFEIADYVSVLRDGSVCYSAPLSESSPEIVVQEMVGDITEVVSEAGLRADARALVDGSGCQAVDGSGSQAPILELRGGSNARLHNVNLQVLSGEILGVVGLLGSGRSALARVLSGIEGLDVGEVLLDGRARRFRGVLEAIRAGVVFVSGNRAREGLFQLQSAEWNLRLGALIAGRRLSRDRITEILQWVRLAPDYLARPVNQLSGGSQQKVLLAKWLAVEPRVIILYDPTAGIDVPTRFMLRRVLRDLRERGVAIIFISSEHEEVREIADRVVAVRRGAITAEADARAISSDSGWQQFLTAI